jgi:murein DD-endopeptidase MepM/ murein hydrolase activator NlpD
MPRCGRPAVLALLLIVSGFGTVSAQNWRASAGYSVQNFGLSVTPNPSFGGDIGFTQKGILGIDLERYLHHRIFLSIQNDFLLQNREDPFFGGPVNFRYASFGTHLGYQWNRTGLYFGVHGGSLWDMEFGGTSTSGGLQEEAWMEADGARSSLFAGIQIGVKYYLFRYLRLEAEYRNSTFLRENFNAPQHNNFIPDASDVRFNTSAFRAGIAISIPFRSSRFESGEPTVRRSLPPLISASGVSFGSPVPGVADVTSPFGHRWGRMHEGVDLDARRGDSVVAAANGIVEDVRYSASYGRMVVIRHGTTYTTLYAHLHSVSVRDGQRVSRGEVIGKAGDSGVATGVHLHFEIRRDGVPVDPERYVRF